MKNPEREKQLAAKEAVRFIGNDQVVGLGSGSTAFFALVEIGELVKKGLRIRGVPTSEKTRIIAESLNIPLGMPGPRRLNAMCRSAFPSRVRESRGPPSAHDWLFAT